MAVGDGATSVGAASTERLGASLDERGNLVIPAAALQLDGRRDVRLVVSDSAAPAGGRSSAAARHGLIAVAAGALALLITIVMFAVHGRSWPWTGFAGETSLWSWLELLVAPVALASLTVRLLTTPRAWRAWRLVAAVAALLMALLIFASYHWRWQWTGFEGKALWDWLTLALFPVTIVLLPEWVRRGEPFGPRAQLGAGVLAVVFTVLVIGGYDWGWTWTGFTGNSFRDWLTLMIAPFLLPVSLKVVHAMHSGHVQPRSASDLVVALSIDK